MLVHARVVIAMVLLHPVHSPLHLSIVVTPYTLILGNKSVKNYVEE